DRDHHHLAAARVLDLERRLERVLVVGVDLELDVLFLDPGAVAADVEPSVLVRDLLDADHDLHGSQSLRFESDLDPISNRPRPDLLDPAFGSGVGASLGAEPRGAPWIATGAAATGTRGTPERCASGTKKTA